MDMKVHQLFEIGRRRPFDQSISTHVTADITDL